MYAYFGDNGKEKEELKSLPAWFWWPYEETWKRENFDIN